MSTDLSTLAVPAYLQASPEELAATNAAAAGGIRTGSFSRISIDGGKFFVVQEGVKSLITDPANPALPRMQLEVVVIGWNPSLSKVFYEGDYAAGDDSEPDCSSDDSITPDVHILEPQNLTCPTCPQNQWGSKISKFSGKEVKACSDIKRLAVLPANDLSFKALGLVVTSSALTTWGKYVADLTKRSMKLAGVVTNLTFDPTVSYPKLAFAFGRFLTPEEFAQVQGRTADDDVKLITSPRAPLVPLLPSPEALLASLPAKFRQDRAPRPEVNGTPLVSTPVSLSGTVLPPAGTPPAPGPADIAPPANKGGFTPSTLEEIKGFGTKPPAEAAKRVRRTKAQIAADATLPGDVLTGNPEIAAPVADPFAHLPPGIKEAATSLGAGSAGAEAILAQFPAPAPKPTAAPIAAAAAAGNLLAILQSKLNKSA